MLLSVEQLQAESGISKHTWRNWIRQKRLAHIRLGRRVRVDRADLERFLAANRVDAREERTR